jgi:hypothetical protein
VPAHRREPAVDVRTGRVSWFSGPSDGGSDGIDGTRVDGWSDELIRWWVLLPNKMK